jgi:hypothetical protein
VYRLTPEATILFETNQSSADAFGVGLVRSFCDGTDIGAIDKPGTGAFLKVA